MSYQPSVPVGLSHAGTIRGRLVNASGKPLAGATVDTSFADEVTTNAAGAFAVRNLVAPYTYVLRISTADMEMGGKKHFQTKKTNVSQLAEKMRRLMFSNS